MAWDSPSSADRYGSVEYKYQYCLDKAYAQVLAQCQVGPLEPYQQRRIHEYMTMQMAALVKLMYQGTYRLKEIRDDEGF